MELVAEWKTVHHLHDHFRRHGVELDCLTVEAYDASAQATLLVGTYHSMKTKRPSLNRPISAEMTTAEALDELYRRLVSVHYGLATGDGEVIARALRKLNALMWEIDEALGREH